MLMTLPLRAVNLISNILMIQSSVTKSKLWRYFHPSKMHTFTKHGSYDTIILLQGSALWAPVHNFKGCWSSKNIHVHNGHSTFIQAYSGKPEGDTLEKGKEMFKMCVFY